MYLERKVGVRSAHEGAAFIGRVAINRTGATLRWRGRAFQSLKGMGYKANYYDVETGERWWISGCRRDGDDALYPLIVAIDEDVREAYWRDVRSAPSRSHEATFRSEGKHTQSGSRGGGKEGAERPGRR
jgi:hypothetical protein